MHKFQTNFYMGKMEVALSTGRSSHTFVRGNQNPILLRLVDLLTHSANVAFAFDISTSKITEQKKSE